MAGTQVVLHPGQMILVRMTPMMTWKFLHRNQISQFRTSVGLEVAWVDSISEATQNQAPSLKIL